MKKQAILELLESMPEEIDGEKLAYKLYVLAKIEAGEAELKAGKYLTQEEAEQEMETWLE